MATYRKDGFKFDRANLRGVDSDCIKGISAYLAQREREINTFTTSVITYKDGPFAGQGVELCDQSPGMLPLDFKGWKGFYCWGKNPKGETVISWRGTTGEPLAIVECGELARRKDAELGKGFTALGDLFAELGEDPAERAFTVTTDKTVSVPQNGQDDYGNALESPRRAGTWSIARECTGFIPSKSRARGGRETRRDVTHSHQESYVSSLFMDDFGDLVNAPGLLQDARIVATMPKQMAVYTIGRTSYKINATAERIDALRALILSKKRYFSDKLIQPARPTQTPEEIARDLEQSEQINTRAAQDVAELVASATAAAAIEQASEASTEAHQAPELETVTAEGEELATVCEHGASAAPVAVYGDLKTGEAFTTTPGGAVYVRCRGGYRPGRGGDLARANADSPVIRWTGCDDDQASSTPAPAPVAPKQPAGGIPFQAINGKSGSWRARFYCLPNGSCVMEFSTAGNDWEVHGFRTGRERMAALQAMARRADDQASGATSAAPAGGIAPTAANPAGYAPTDASDHQQTAPVPSGADNMPRDLENDGGTTTSPAAPAGALSITITRAEGYEDECGRPVTVYSFAAADDLLRAWSESAPAHGGYDKCDFAITWPDGGTYEGRYDLKHHTAERPSLTAHMVDLAEFYTGANCPAHMSTADYARFMERNDEETRAAYAEVLATLGALGVYFPKVRPVAVDLAQVVAGGVNPDQLVGLGVVCSGDMANDSGTGAIVAAALCDYYKLSLTVQLEDGREMIAHAHDFDGTGRGWFRLDQRMHGAPYLAQLAGAVAAKKASASAQKEIAATEHARQLAELVQAYPQLKRPDSDHSGAKLAAVNMRILLKAAFKGVKFSVTSERYSSARVRWSDGPTVDQVNAIIGRFDIGASDSQSDYFYTVRTAWSELFGGVQYLSVNRDDSPALIERALIDLYPDATTRPSVGDWQTARGVFDWRSEGEHARREFREHLASIDARAVKA